ncbi:hypothetical protein HELRODRAFT_181033 [Helobdella robusta]|uniref:Uncharacterized protein n=1 Tax=Helobdella robusta TaxID=6412 RepID=T1FGJ6_HELRO|nr:hypothetical protein HELRODRAFT_181033 [Helobdella robusta]ESN93287.1 hypothetical protein HELRODRAFT_181033 [Helobdella robusta]
MVVELSSESRRSDYILRTTQNYKDSDANNSSNKFRSNNNTFYTSYSSSAAATNSSNSSDFDDFRRRLRGTSVQKDNYAAGRTNYMATGLSGYSSAARDRKSYSYNNSYNDDDYSHNNDSNDARSSYSLIKAPNPFPVSKLRKRLRKVICETRGDPYYFRY